ncbi:MAG: tetratricopeptide repeat protein [Desulfobacterales bacterium]|jgi:tetratricopeptide (TPR) repeat protein
MNRELKPFFILLIILISATQVLAATKLTTLVKKIQPAVVTIIAYDMNNEVANIGTGFFVDKKGGLITNHHVLIGKYGAEVRTSDGNTYPVTSILAENKPADLVKVLVDIPSGKFRWLEVSENLPAIAQRVVVSGSPMGLDQTVSEGIVSSIREIPALGIFFQMSAPISPGSSGSPVVDMNGKVLGVATFQYQQGQNLNFAISGKSVRELKAEGPGTTISEWTYRLSKQKPRIAEKLCRTGFNFSINGQDQKALHYFQKATERDPNDPVAWYGLGYCHAGLKNHDSAIEAYKQAIRVNPYDESTYFHLGNYYNKLGRHQDAIVAYKEVIRINPEFEAAYFNLGVAYARLGRLDEGREAFETVTRINPKDATAYFNVGIAYSQLGQYREAIEAHKQVIRLKPDFAPAHYNLGIVYGKLGRPEAELESYKDAIRIDPDFAPAHFNMGQAFLQQGNKAAALDQYKILKNIDQDAADKLFDLIY